MAAIQQADRQILAAAQGKTVASPTNRGLMASTNPQANTSGAQGFGQSLSGGAGAMPQGISDALEKATQALQSSAAELKKAKEKQVKESILLDVKKTLLSNANIKELLGAQGTLNKSIANYDTNIEGSANVNPLAQLGTINNDLGRLAESATLAGGSVNLRQGGVNQVLDSIRTSQKQDMDLAKSDFDTQKGLLGSIIDLSGEQRQRELQPLEKEKLTAEIAKIRSDANDKNPNIKPGDVTSLSSNSQAVMRNPALFNEFTPTEKAKIISELQTYGVSDDQLAELTYANLSDAARKEISQFDGVISLGQQALDALNSGTFGTGPLQSVVNEAKSVAGAPPPGWVKFAALASVSSVEELRRQSGVAVTPQEFDRLKAYLPKKNDQEAQLAEKLPLFLKTAAELQANRAKRALQTSVSLGREFGDKGSTNNQSTAPTNLPPLDSFIKK